MKFNSRKNRLEAGCHQREQSEAEEPPPWWLFREGSTGTLGKAWIVANHEKVGPSGPSGWSLSETFSPLWSSSGRPDHGHKLRVLTKMLV